MSDTFPTATSEARLARFLAALESPPICPECDAGDPTSACAQPGLRADGSIVCRECGYTGKPA